MTGNLDEALRVIEKQAKLIEELIGGLKAAWRHMLYAQWNGTRRGANRTLDSGIERIREALEKAK